MFSMIPHFHDLSVVMFIQARQSLHPKVAQMLLDIRHIRCEFVGWLLSSLAKISQKNARLLFINSLGLKGSGVSRSGYSRVASRSR